MIASSATSVIGSAILLGAVGVTIWQCIVRSGGSSWFARVVVTVVGTVVVAGVVGFVLDAVGLDVDRADATAELRDELRAAGYTPAERDCVERAVIREHGSIDAIVTADDLTGFLTAMITCKPAFGMDGPMIRCWAAELVDHFDIERLDAGAVSDIDDAMSEPEHHRFAAVASLTCQGVPREAAECIYETVIAAHPEMLGDRTPGLTAEQQGWLLDAGRDCGVA